MKQFYDPENTLCDTPHHQPTFTDRLANHPIYPASEATLNAVAELKDGDDFPILLTEHGDFILSHVGLDQLSNQYYEDGYGSEVFEIGKGIYVQLLNYEGKVYFAKDIQAVFHRFLELNLQSGRGDISVSVEDLEISYGVKPSLIPA